MNKRTHENTSAHEITNADLLTDWLNSFQLSSTLGHPTQSNSIKFRSNHTNPAPEALISAGRARASAPRETDKWRLARECASKFRSTSDICPTKENHRQPALRLPESSKMKRARMDANAGHLSAPSQTRFVVVHLAWHTWPYFPREDSVKVFRYTHEATCPCRRNSQKEDFRVKFPNTGSLEIQ